MDSFVKDQGLGIQARLRPAKRESSSALALQFRYCRILNDRSSPVNQKSDQDVILRVLCVSVVKLFLQGAGEGPGEVGERRVGGGGRGDRQDVARGESRG